MDDALFKALADPTRRALLDMLRETDGQTLSDLEGRLGMTRFGVMKHLKVLEAAHLVLVRRSGRFKHHYLNAVPLQEVIDRWMDPLVQKPMARMALDLKARLEGKPMTATTAIKPDFVLQTFIETSPEKLWEALTTGKIIGHYHFACSDVQGDFVQGGEIVFRTADGATMLTNRVTAIEHGKRIEFEFVPGWAGPDSPASRCVYLVEPAGGTTCLTVEHYAIPEGQDGVREGWARYTAGLKTWLETGKAMSFEGTAGGGAR